MADDASVKFMTVENADSNMKQENVWLLPGVIWAAIFTTLLLLYQDVAAALIRTWSTSPSFEHGYAVLFVAVALIWLRRHEYSQSTPRPAVWGLGLLILAAVVMTLGDAASVLLLQQFALVAMVQASILAIFGWPFVRKNLFPLCYLYFAIPVGDFIVPALRDLTGILTVEFLSFAGVRATLDGFLIRLPTADYRVAEACAGLRFFIVGLAVSLLAAYLFLRSWRRRIIFLVLALFIPIFGNALRAASVILLEQKGLFDATTLFGHLTYGLGFTSVLIAALLTFAYLLRDTNWLTSAAARPGVEVDLSDRKDLRSRSILVAILGPLIIAAPSAWMKISMPEKRSIVDLAELKISQEWRPVEDLGDGWHPTAYGADAEIRRSYRDGERVLNIYIAYFPVQRQGSEAVSDAHRLVESNGWIEIARRAMDVETDAYNFRVDAIEIKSGARRRLVMPFYWVGDRLVGDPMYAKILQVKDTLFGRPAVTAVIVLSANYDQNADEAASVLQSYLSKSYLVSALRSQRTR